MKVFPRQNHGSGGALIFFAVSVRILIVATSPGARRLHRNQAFTHLKRLAGWYSGNERLTLFFEVGEEGFAIRIADGGDISSDQKPKFERIIQWFITL